MAGVSGHVKRVNGKRTGLVFRIKWRDTDGQHEKTLGPAWVDEQGRERRRGDPPFGLWTQTTAEAELQEVLAKARKGKAGKVRRGVTFGDAAVEWLRHRERHGQVKPSTLEDY